MANSQDQSVQHKEIEVQTTPRNNSLQQNQHLLDQNDMVIQDQNNHHQYQENHNEQQDFQHQDNSLEMNNFEYKSYLNPDQAKSPSQQQQASAAAPQVIKKKCENCTSGQVAQRLKQQQQEVHKLKIQNDKLLAQLRQMSIQLDETLEKFKVKKNEKPALNQEQTRRDVNESELENAKQQLEFYTKQIAMYANQDQEFSSNRVNQWQQSLKEIDYQLNEAKVFNKNLLYIKREQERTMQSNKESTKIKMLRDETMHLKSLIREARRVLKDNEKGFKKTQEHTEKLKLRHEEVCKQFGVPFAPFESLAKDERIEIKIEDEKDKGKFHVLKINEENIFKLQNHLKIVDDSINASKKQFKVDIKQQQKILDHVSKEKQDIQVQLDRREKELQEAYDSLNNFKAIASNSTSNLNGLKVIEASKPTKSGSLQVIAPYVKKYKVQKNDLKGLPLNDKNQLASR
ncbi:hypothetical protein TTHERM_00383600 (macronuclear) [Tetrahymena thermophila SB210]|uniref:Uncharacterized protein n=1 Tax=Tetrahymena thermophila (strain SB210) TaxID=312017 RepID=Q23F53_TETTS|nr:hypothetical protein TTHERM_00383600 [Tetrahymena thermophila SB210]EAR95300.2 hypothetical protein TTHERM_00383600 [Tetrahymena thermophila SB210]|eukprot:XP_001015545.2 hypothetical protein TTHERM_00383600 [Tetrahymena thermophila SB210]